MFHRHMHYPMSLFFKLKHSGYMYCLWLYKQENRLGYCGEGVSVVTFTFHFHFLIMFDFLMNRSRY